MNYGYVLIFSSREAFALENRFISAAPSFSNQKFRSNH